RAGKGDGADVEAQGGGSDGACDGRPPEPLETRGHAAKVVGRRDRLWLAPDRQDWPWWAQNRGVDESGRGGSRALRRHRGVWRNVAVDVAHERERGEAPGGRGAALARPAGRAAGARRVGEEPDGRRSPDRGAADRARTVRARGRAAHRHRAGVGTWRG